jgi:hypothetical protein
MGTPTLFSLLTTQLGATAVATVHKLLTFTTSAVQDARDAGLRKCWPSIFTSTLRSKLMAAHSVHNVTGCRSQAGCQARLQRRKLLLLLLLNRIA